MPTRLIIIIKVNSLILKQPSRVRLFEHIWPILKEIQLLEFSLNVLLCSFIESTDGQFVSDAHGVALLDNCETFGLLALSLDVFTLAELFHD